MVAKFKQQSFIIGVCVDIYVDRGIQATVLFDMFDVLHKIFEFINFVYWDSYAKPRFLASFHKSSDVVTPDFLPYWGQGTHLNGARDASHTPWCLILACFNHLSNCLAPVGIWDYIPDRECVLKYVYQYI